MYLYVLNVDIYIQVALYVVNTYIIYDKLPVCVVYAVYPVCISFYSSLSLSLMLSLWYVYVCSLHICTIYILLLYVYVCFAPFLPPFRPNREYIMVIRIPDSRGLYFKTDAMRRL